MKWKLVISNDCAQQTDSNNCGVFVILNIAAMFVGHQLTGIENQINIRNYIQYINIYKLESLNECFLVDLPKFMELKIDSIRVEIEPTNNYISFVIEEVKNKKLTFKCPFPKCLGIKEKHNSLLCILCRNYYHYANDALHKLQNLIFVNFVKNK